MKQRLKSYKFWVSLSGAVIIFIKALGEALNFQINPEVINSIIMGFCGVLVVLGIVEKPASTETKIEENQTTTEIIDNDTDKKE